MANGVIDGFLDDTEQRHRNCRIEIPKAAAALVDHLPSDRLAAFPNRPFQMVLDCFRNTEKLQYSGLGFLDDLAKVMHTLLHRPT
ncbi:hypothetical protein D3C80_1031090 [compost metagenome]